MITGSLSSHYSSLLSAWWRPSMFPTLSLLLLLLQTLMNTVISVPSPTPPPSGAPLGPNLFHPFDVSTPLSIDALSSLLPLPLPFSSSPQKSLSPTPLYSFYNFNSNNQAFTRHRPPPKASSPAPPAASAVGLSASLFPQTTDALLSLLIPIFSAVSRVRFSQSPPSSFLPSRTAKPYPAAAGSSPPSGNVSEFFAFVSTSGLRLYPKPFQPVPPLPPTAFLSLPESSLTSPSHISHHQSSLSLVPDLLETLTSSISSSVKLLAPSQETCHEGEDPVERHWTGTSGLKPFRSSSSNVLSSASSEGGSRHIPSQNLSPSEFRGQIRGPSEIHLPVSSQNLRPSESQSLGVSEIPSQTLRPSRMSVPSSPCNKQGLDPDIFLPQCRNPLLGVLLGLAPTGSGPPRVSLLRQRLSLFLSSSDEGLWAGPLAPPGRPLSGGLWTVQFANCLIKVALVDRSVPNLGQAVCLCALQDQTENAAEREKGVGAEKVKGTGEMRERRWRKDAAPFSDVIRGREEGIKEGETEGSGQGHAEAMTETTVKERGGGGEGIGGGSGAAARGDEYAQSQRRGKCGRKGNAGLRTWRCQLINAMLLGLACLQEVHCGRSSAPGVDYINGPAASPSTAALPLVDLLSAAAPSSPSSVPSLPLLVPPSVIAAEGFSYYTLWHAVLYSYHLFKQAACQSRRLPREVPQPGGTIEGWQPQVYIALGPEGVLPFHLRPFGVLSRRGDSLLLVLRGSFTIIDWLVDFQYNFESLPRLRAFPLRPTSAHPASASSSTSTAFSRSSSTASTAAADFRWSAGRVHRGFAKLARAILPAVVEYIDGASPSSSAYTSSSPSSSFSPPWRPDRIVVTGHSAGSGAGALIAYALACIYSGGEASLDCPQQQQQETQQRQETQAQQQQRPVRVDAVLFATPRFGDKAFSESFRRKVNSRAVVFDLDTVPELPCQEMPLCRGGEANSGERGVAIVETAERRGAWAGSGSAWCGEGEEEEEEEGTVIYGPQVGVVKFSTDEMPSHSFWRTADLPNLEIGANHICAYSCWLYHKFGKTEVGLDTTTASFCSAAGSPNDASTAWNDDVCTSLL